jgi:hypothetical protein
MIETTDQAIAGARATLNGFIASLNREDADAIRSGWFHFPHVRFHAGR